MTHPALIERITRSLLLELNWLPPDHRSAAAGAALSGVRYDFSYTSGSKGKTPPRE